MVNALLILLFSFLIILITEFFRIGFIKGEVYDITKAHPKEGGKLDKYLVEVKESIEYINSLSYEWVSIKSFDNLTLKARFFKNSSNKIIILFHGYRSIAENDFGPIFKLYYELEYNILLIDQRAHGKSEGKYISFGINERYDCLSWCKFISDNYNYIDEIILGGMSMGSTTILLATELDLPSKVKGIIADCGFTSPKDIISKVVSSRYGLNPEIMLPAVNILCRGIAKFNIYECSVKNAMNKNKLPILFIHGTSDDFVPSKMSKENFEACKTRKKLVLVDCVFHGLSYLTDKLRIEKEVKDFLYSIA